MKHINVVQYTPEWWRERLGKPTASQFHKIITPAGRKTGGPWYDYMFQLVYERIVKRQVNTTPVNYWMQRGRLLEPHAAKTFSKLTGQELFEAGVFFTDDMKIAASPDKLISERHAVELKCPAPWQHIQYTVRGPVDDYKAQMQGQMYVGEFDTVSFLSYNPGMPCIIHTVVRNEEYIKLMATLLREFTDELMEQEAKARVLGDYAAVEIEINAQTSSDNSMDD